MFKNIFQFLLDFLIASHSPTYNYTIFVHNAQLLFTYSLYILFYKNNYFCYNKNLFYKEGYYE